MRSLLVACTLTLVACGGSSGADGGGSASGGGTSTAGGGSASGGGSSSGGGSAGGGAAGGGAAGGGAAGGGSAGGGAAGGGAAGGGSAGGGAAGGGSAGGGAAGGGSAGGGSAGGGSASGGGSGGAITAPNEQWTWVDFPNSACGNGAATGIGVNLTNQGTDVVIYLQGGGACWNNLTCHQIGTATNLKDGYGTAQFANEATKNASFFDRSRTDNPFRTHDFVFVPYCTGDVHGGDAVQTYDPQNMAKKTSHKGRANMAAFLARLAPTFANAQKVYLVGSSAGAFGAQINYPAVAAAFPNAQVHLLADSGQMVNPASGLLAQWTASWNLQNPPGCTDCLTDFTRFPAWLASTYPQRRFALLAYTRDQVLSQFFGYNAADYETQTRALLTSRYDATSNAKYFLLAGTQHTMLANVTTITAPNGGPTLQTWITRWKDADAAWANVLAPP